MKNILLILLFYPLTIFFLNSCANNSKHSRKPVSAITVLPQAQKYPYGTTVSVHVETKLKDGRIKNIQLFHNNTLIKESREMDFTVEEIKLQKTGSNTFTATAIKTDDIENSRSISINVVSDITPERFSYSIVNKYPHNKKYYTQGLEYYNGYMYEGTGEYGSSALYKTDLITGKSLMEHKLPDKYFGEGVTILNNRIYQLTYKAQKGFIYDFENFALIDSFVYKSAEGWGLTNDGKNLIMSNGTNELIWIDPNNFSEIKRIFVVNNRDKVNYLNELEYINNTIFANIYTTDLIVQIDPETGKIISEIDLKGILNLYINKEDTVDYLNGIAYDKLNNRMFITGKWWPYIFEIEMVKSK